MKKVVAIVVVVLLLAVLAGCGGGGGGSQVVTPPPPGSTSVTIQQDPAIMPVGTTFQFTATVSGAGGNGVIWSVQEGSAAGSFSTTTLGLYTAPSLPGSYHAVATSQTDSTKKDSAEIIVVPWTSGNGYQEGNYTLVAIWGSEGGSVGSGRGQFLSPRGIAVDASGNVYVSDSGHGLIQKFSNNGLYMSEWITSGTVPIGWGGPIAISERNDLYMLFGLNRYYNEIYMRTHDDYNLRWEVHVSPGVDLDARNGLIYMTNPNNGNTPNVVVSGLEGPGGPWCGTGYLDDPTGIAIDGAGNVYVVDRQQATIDKFRSGDGAHIQTIGMSSSGVVEPCGLDVDLAGNVYVSDLRSCQIFKFSPAGLLQTKWGSSGIGPGQFLRPTCVEVDARGNVFVLDEDNNRVQKFQPT